MQQPLFTAGLLSLSFIGSPAALLAQAEGESVDYETAWQHFQALKEAAGGGAVNPAFDALPDWSGVFWRQGECGNSFAMPPCPPRGETEAVLTEAAQAEFDAKIERLNNGLYYDYLSECKPAGYPRWLSEPFMREFVVRPEQVWMINEMVSEVRRIYTDGRGHAPRELTGSTWEGDTIGFWDGDRLITHTENSHAGEFQRNAPNYSDQVETVEIWQRNDAGTLVADVWIYDPLTLVEPWRVEFTYEPAAATAAEAADIDPLDFRVNMFSPCENENNAVVRTESGGNYEEGALDFLNQN